uniref:AMP-dependent synthetase/ligase domain-containing protein n=1 Tax=Corethron hystrix TaxID=216773 RepID=A0A7S1BQL2_9STRA|mmetsp:Transcript_36132/g.84432  ORF Transcript_36132/g.84432 Transcript_36132/m.84432 type:complete len:755 (+) Transcript_36132:674-2938(+)
MSYLFSLLLKMSKSDEEILFGGEAVLQLDSESGKQSAKSRTPIPLSKPGEIPSIDVSSFELVNALHRSRGTVQSCPGIWLNLASLCPDNQAIFDAYHCDEKIDMTFSEVERFIRQAGAAFRKLGVNNGDNVAIFGENSAKWLLADHGVQIIGGVTAVRGADAPEDELRYIYENSESCGVAILQGPKLLKKLAIDAKKCGLPGLGFSNEKFGAVREIVLMHKEKMTNDDIVKMVEDLELTDINVKVFSDMVEEEVPLTREEHPPVGRDDLSTIVYTSGTTGSPKGASLTHGNLIHQLGHRLAPSKPYDETEPLPGDVFLALLPVWHITERTFELWQLSRGCKVVYSSIRTFKNDLEKHKPHWMVLVPRVLEKVAQGVQNKFSSGSAIQQNIVKLFTTIGMLSKVHEKKSKGLVVGNEPLSLFEYLISSFIVAALSPLNAVGNKLVWSKVQAGFGGRQKLIVSGGSALPGSLESFYECCGVPIVVGYGLSECSPIISHRRLDENLVTAGCVGFPAKQTELRVTDPDSKAVDGERSALPDGEVGVVLVRGPQVMKGYYNNLKATEGAIDRFGWFDTGDLGRINPATGDLILTGRAKDTIVLSNGENIEPVPIEDAIMAATETVEQVMLTGQDGRRLTAIMVLNPTELEKAGFLDSSLASKLQKANEIVNDPKCTIEDGTSYLETLSEASTTLRANKALIKSIKGTVKEATSKFRAWERVNDVYITLEPFAMANGLLTQSFKVKRDAVMKKFGDKLDS